MTLPLYTSGLLASVPGVSHGFTNRHGGVSEAPYDSLNVARGVGDVDASVDENRRRVAAALGRPDARWWALNQVHGAHLVEGGASETPVDADAHWSANPGGLLAIKVADCVPVLFASRDGRMVAAAHAGWRGTRGRIVSVVVAAMEKRGVSPRDILVALGPAIGPESFEIGSEVVEELAEAFPRAPASALWSRPDGKGHADLWALNTLALVEAGVPEGNVDALRICTVETPDLYSYRRDHGRTGRQAGVIGSAPIS